MFYAIYMEKAANSDEDIGLPGEVPDLAWCYYPHQSRAALVDVDGIFFSQHGFLNCNISDNSIAQPIQWRSPPKEPCCTGSIELVKACREAGLRVAVASSADRVKVHLSPASHHAIICPSAANNVSCR